MAKEVAKHSGLFQGSPCKGPGFVSRVEKTTGSIVHLHGILTTAATLFVLVVVLVPVDGWKLYGRVQLCTCAARTFLLWPCNGTKSRCVYIGLLPLAILRIIFTLLTTIVSLSSRRVWQLSFILPSHSLVQFSLFCWPSAFTSLTARPILLHSFIH